MIHLYYTYSVSKLPYRRAFISATSNREFPPDFLKIASKGFVCTLESYKGFVCTVTLRAMCDIALLFDGFAPKPLRKINVYSCSKQRLWTSKDRQWTLQQ